MTYTQSTNHFSKCLRNVCLRFRVLCMCVCVCVKPGSEQDPGLAFLFNLSKSLFIYNSSYPSSFSHAIYLSKN